MGFPISAAILTIKKLVPFLIPIWRISEIWAITAATKETNAPDVKPIRPAKTMKAALEVAVSQRAKTMMQDRRLTTIMVLKRPILSATWPAPIRPTALKQVKRIRNDQWCGF